MSRFYKGSVENITDIIAIISSSRSYVSPGSGPVRFELSRSGLHRVLGEVRSRPHGPSQKEVSDHIVPSLRALCHCKWNKSTIIETIRFCVVLIRGVWGHSQNPAQVDQRFPWAMLAIPLTEADLERLMSLFDTLPASFRSSF